MLRILAIVSVTISSLTCVLAQTNKEPVLQSGQMIFRLASNGGTSGDEWIVADGEISSETPKVFRRFLGSEKIERGARYEVYLNSPGGNLFGGVQLGEIFREFGFGTRVARSVKNGMKIGNYEFENRGVGACYSACSFAFLLTCP